MQEKPPIVQPGQKFRGKKHNTIFIIRKIEGNEIELVSPDGTASMHIQSENLALLDLEPFYD